MNNIVVNRLIVLLNETSRESTTHHIALTMLENFSCLRNMNVNAIADLCNTSKSTISKFIHMLGYRDFFDFRTAIEMEDTKYRPQSSYVHDVIGYLDSHSYEDYAKLLARDIVANVNQIDMDAIRRLAREIHDHQHVAAFGLMFSETAALDLQTKLGRLGKYISTNMNDRKQYEYIEGADQDVLIIVFSESGTFLDRYDMCDPVTGKSVFFKTKARVVMVTANKNMANNPLLDDIVLFFHSPHMHTHRIMYPLLTDVVAHEYSLLIH